MMPEEFTEEERKVLTPFVTNIDKPVFVLKNLPEVIKGALFSRYSRSSKSLRRLLLDEFIQNPETGFQAIAKQGQSGEGSLKLEKAQDFYDRILDGYGDDSIGELGGAHIAVENISNIGSKIIEDPRIGGSPLEKSTRYIFFNKKKDDEYLFYREPVIMDSKFSVLYIETCNMLFDVYSSLVDPMKKYFMDLVPQQEGIPDKAYKFSIRARACDALRGFLPASTVTNVGIFGNGRFFENLIIRLRCSELVEMRNLANSMQKELHQVIPSFVRRAAPDHKHFKPFQEFFTDTRLGVRKTLKDLEKVPQEERGEVELVDYDEKAEIKVIAGIMYPDSKLPMRQLLKIAEAMTAEEKSKLLNEYAGRRNNRRHKPGRAFEHTHYTFDILGDYGNYRDLHRHRMLTQERQYLSTTHGFDVPPELTDAGFEAEFKDAMMKADFAFKQIAEKYPIEAQYVVPFAYKIRWYFKLALREVMWLTELRSSEQGHPNYRRVAQKMYTEVKKVHPSLAEYIKFVDMNDYALGRLSAEIKKEKKNEFQ